MSKITKKMVKEFISDYDRKDYDYIRLSCLESIKEFNWDYDLLEDNDIDTFKKFKNYMKKNGNEFLTLDEDDLQNFNDIDEVFEDLNSGLEINYRAVEYIEENLLED
jgi:hypothetical protein